MPAQRRVEAKAGQDRGRAGRGALGPDGAQPLVDLRLAKWIGAVLLGHQRDALGVGGQHRVDQAFRDRTAPLA